MKRGDKIPVNLRQYEVAEAVVVEIDGDEVILEIPATRIVMGLIQDVGDLDRTPEKDRAETKLPEGGGESPLMDEARAALLEAGVEIDDDDDFQPLSTNDDGTVSLKDMNLDDDV